MSLVFLSFFALSCVGFYFYGIISNIGEGVPIYAAVGKGCVARVLDVALPLPCGSVRRSMARVRKSFFFFLFFPLGAARGPKPSAGLVLVMLKEEQNREGRGAGGGRAVDVRGIVV